LQRVTNYLQNMLKHKQDTPSLRLPHLRQPDNIIEEGRFFRRGRPGWAAFVHGVCNRNDGLRIGAWLSSAAGVPAQLTTLASAKDEHEFFRASGNLSIRWRNRRSWNGNWRRRSPRSSAATSFQSAIPWQVSPAEPGTCEKMQNPGFDESGV
jgi:hypothetical protein